MKTVILDVRKPEDAMADFSTVWTTGKPQKSARISFATPELLWRVLTPKRWALLKVLCGAEPVSIREAAESSNPQPLKPMSSVEKRFTSAPGP